MTEQQLQTIGWLEWVRLPDLGIRHLKAKVDTGARTSSIHAFDIVSFERDGVDFVRFDVHPKQRDDTRTVTCEVPVLEYRAIRSSNGQEERRPVIETSVELAGQVWSIELNLTNRDAMGFRMLLGREAFRGRCLVDVSQTYVSGRPSKKTRKRSKNPDS